MSAIYWGVQRFGEETFDLSHLRPFMVTVTPAKQPDRTINVVVSFGFHVFTRKRAAGDSGKYFMGTANDPRTFSPERLECSRQLPLIIREACSGRVQFSHSESFRIPRQLPKTEGEYATIFRLEKSDAGESCVRMFVISAHLREPLVNPREINFAKLVTCVADGLPFPRK